MITNRLFLHTVLVGCQQPSYHAALGRDYDRISMHRTSIILILTLTSTLAFAQGPAQTSPTLPPETAEVARGWTLLAQGQTAKAAALAGQLLARHGRSVAVLALAVDAEIARGGAAAGLDLYERWVKNKPTEDGYAVRRVARAMLVEIAHLRQDQAARLHAIEALSADGETQLAAELRGTAAAGGAAPSGGSPAKEDNVAELLAVLAKPLPNRASAIAALAKTRSQRAVKPLIGLLQDPDPIVRAAAADALGTLGATSAVTSLKPLLNDPNFTVHRAAASALYALKDMSGLPFLRELQSSEHAPIRLAASRAMHSDADENWLAVVRSLLKDADPEVRREAAELIAPHDPDAARTTLEALLNDSNPAERDAANHSYLQYAVTDFATLRRFLRADEGMVRARAAARVLELTR